MLEAVFRRHDSGVSMLIVSAGIWAAVIVLTLMFLVPINNRMARIDARSWSEEARQQHDLMGPAPSHSHVCAGNGDGLLPSCNPRMRGARGTPLMRLWSTWLTCAHGSVGVLRPMIDQFVHYHVPDGVGGFKGRQIGAVGADALARKAIRGAHAARLPVEIADLLAEPSRAAGPRARRGQGSSMRAGCRCPPSPS